MAGLSWKLAKRAVCAIAAIGCSRSAGNLPDAAVPGDIGVPSDAAFDAAPGCTIYSSDAGPSGAGVPIFDSADAVLADATVKASVTAVQNLQVGKLFLPTLDHAPPDLTGTYSVAQGTAKLVATSDGTQVGAVLGSSQAKVSTFCDDVLQNDAISSVNGMPVTTATSFAYARGSGQMYSTYGLTIGVCTEQGSDFTYFLANISSGQIDRTKHTDSYDSLLINLGTAGTLTPACAARLVHAIQIQGGWALIQATATVRP